jgi:hypothetical protein
MRVLFAWLCEHAQFFWAGAVLYRSNGCITLHAVGVTVRTRMPHARGVAPVRRDPPETRWLLATNEEDGRAPSIAAGSGYVACGNLSTYAEASALISTPSGTKPVST